MEELDVNHPYILSFNDIKQAAERIEEGIIHTPLCEAKFSKVKNYDIYLKCENLQYTGSCLERGMRNLFLAKNDELSVRGAMVPSNEDMALSAAYQSGTMGVPVTVVLPEGTPPAQAQRCTDFGADVVLCGQTLDDATTYAKKVQRDSRQIIISSDDPLMMAGLGTIGLEIITQLPETDAVIVPVGTGALLAGILVACKKLKCSCLVYGAECAKVPKMMKALQAGKPVAVPVVPNLADGLNASAVGTNIFATIKGRLDRMLVVDETYIARAIITMLERERLVVDGAGVCAVAAVMQGLVPELRGKRAVCVVSSGNVECGRLCRVIQRGLCASGRLVRCAVPLAERRGGLAPLVAAAAGAPLRSLVTEQMWLHGDVGSTWANVVVETANDEHAANFKDRLREAYPSARFAVIDLDEKHNLSVRQ